MENKIPGEKKSPHINCFHMTRFALMGYLTTQILFEVLVMRNSSTFPFTFAGVMFLPFLMALWVAVNTVGRRLYKPQTAKVHMGLAWASTIIILYLTPALYFLGTMSWDFYNHGTVREAEVLAGITLYPLIGMVYGIPGAVIFGTWLGRSVHARLGNPAMA